MRIFAPALSLCIALSGAGCVVEDDSLDADDAVADDDIASEAYELAGPAQLTVAAGNDHSCSVAGDGTVQCWGRGSYGQLGNGSTASSSTPANVSGISDAIAVTTGAAHSCALRAGGTVRCWGHGAYGQLGNGSTSNRTTPVNVSGLSHVVAISAGAYHTCAVKDYGEVFCWGYNAFGALGNGSTTNATTPKRVGREISVLGFKLFNPEQGVLDVAAGSWSTCVRNNSGQARCWGRNNAGQLGDNTTTQRTNAVTVQGLSNVADIAAGDRHACAVRTDGRVWCWGSNTYGQLGDNTTTQRKVPVRAQGMSNARAVTAGGSHTCAISQSDALRCTGRNNYGQLGRTGGDVRTLSSTPIVAVQASAGASHTCTRALTGAVQCFGRNSWGQLGGFDECSDDMTLTLESVTAPEGDIYSRWSGIHYLTGDDAQLSLITAECAEVTGVTLAGQHLGTAPNPDGGGRYYRILSRTSLGDGTTRVSIRLYYDNPENGTTYPVEVDVMGVNGEEMSVSTLLVGAVQVEGPGALIHISQTEIRNEVIAGIYDKFGDSNYYDRDKYPDLYDFDYESLNLHADSAGIAFSAKAKARVLGGLDICDPTAHVNGRFTIVPDGLGIKTQWESSSVNTVFPVACAVVTLNIVPAIGEIVDWTTDDNIERRIDKRIRKFGALCEEPFGCNNTVEAINHISGAVEIVVKPLVETVTIRTAYDTDELRDADGFGDPLVRGMAVPGSRHLTFSSSGTVITCSTPVEDCEPRFVSGTGVFNRDVNPPVPSPWPECPSPPCPYYEGRQGAWVSMLGARRDPELLPLPDHNVGAVVGRTFSRNSGGELLQGAPFYAGDHLCVIPPVGADRVQLVLGRNDINAPTGGFAGEYGTGEGFVTIGFPNVGVAEALDVCEE